MQMSERPRSGRAHEQRLIEGRQAKFPHRLRHHSTTFAACAAAVIFFAAILSGASPAEAVTGYHVVVGSSGLNAHSGPGTAFPVIGKLYNGQPINISCQTKGTLVGVGLPGTPTDVWDRLTNGWFITDYYTSTPGMAGAFTPSIPLCAETPIPPPPTAPPAPPVANQPSDGCAQVRVVGARGSGENPFINNSPAGMGLEVDSFYTTLKSLLPGVDVRYWADPYPAIPVPGNILLNLPGWGGGPYLQSVQYGELFADRYVYDHLHGCPSEHLIMVGYSQGADVMHEVWNNTARNGGLDVWRGRLDGLVLFADPHFDPAQRTSIPAYSLDIGIGDLGWSNHAGIAGATPVEWTPQQETSHFMHSYCRAGDPVCDFPNSNISIHTSYAANGVGVPQGAAPALSRWLAGHYFH